MEKKIIREEQEVPAERFFEMVLEGLKKQFQTCIIREFEETLIRDEIDEYHRTTYIKARCKGFIASLGGNVFLLAALDITGGDKLYLIQFSSDRKRLITGFLGARGVLPFLEGCYPFFIKMEYGSFISASSFVTWRSHSNNLYKPTRKEIIKIKGTGFQDRWEIRSFLTKETSIQTGPRDLIVYPNKSGRFFLEWVEAVIQFLAWKAQNMEKTLFEAREAGVLSSWLRQAG